MTSKLPPLNVYWSQDLKDAFDSLRQKIRDQRLDLSRTQLAEFALNQFVKNYLNNEHQLLLDFGVTSQYR